MHQTITNVKFMALCRRLAIPTYRAVGVLESLWLFAQIHARDGDLSRFTPLELAGWLGWDGGNDDDLIAALVEARWLDRDGDSLTIHDWDEHKPNYLKGTAAAARKREAPKGGPKTPPKDAPKDAPKDGSKDGSKDPPPNLTKPNPTKPNGASAPGPDGPAFELAEKKAPKKPKASGPVSANPPTVADVSAYCVSRTNGLDAEAFVAHYTANGWKQSSGLPIVDWRATVINWEKRRKERDQPATIPMANRRGEYYPSDEELREAIER